MDSSDIETDDADNATTSDEATSGVADQPTVPAPAWTPSATAPDVPEVDPTDGDPDELVRVELLYKYPEGKKHDLVDIPRRLLSKRMCRVIEVDPAGD